MRVQAADMPWNDRAGRFSRLRLVACLIAFGPALILILDAAIGDLGAKPLTEAIHRTGEWAVRLLILTLAITPLRRITGWNRLITVRRLLGLATFGYAFGHFVLYWADQNWNPARIVTELVSRVYLTIGFAALAGLAVLAATSTDGAIHRLGNTWQKLHRIGYLCAALAILHFFMQAKIDADQAALMLGFFLLVMSYRAAHALGLPLASPFTLIGVAGLGAVVTAFLEAGWYGVATRIPWQAVLSANLQLAPEPRPAFWILVVGVLAALLPFRRRLVAFRIARSH
ncbi:sulfite oxidase heme-binding subunit YedZ [Amorphus orientalis]|uniref:Protein-methionine-sulfoxide reductase heme-binding subunit MsrQ n=1 Tax=Amorphus orientalis TaxID=649198 RepID=A0AAE3VPW7_9HYPH|nr:protein-methionine-sulfoxide reductase heme-binding subunit MsrQ [Amorphus orientalis]MDQ0316112.1 sulfoxide reductase heme-binding subunit YedZ [Amorphus orientalis]